MPEIDYPHISGSHKTAPHHDIRIEAQDRQEQFPIVGRVVFEIGILEENIIAGRRFNPFADRGALAAVLRHLDKAGIEAGILLEQGYRFVFGTVINHDDFKYSAGNGLCLHLREHFEDRLFLVIGGYDNAYFQHISDRIPRASVWANDLTYF